MSIANRRGWLVTVAVASLALSACGGSSRHSAGSATTSTRSNGSGGGASVTTGPVRATLKGESHDPTVGKKWIYTVTASDAQGHPLSGTVDTGFAFQGTVVGHETPPTHALRNGHLKDVIEFPAESVGYAIELQTVVHTHAGSVTLDWPVSVST